MPTAPVVDFEEDFEKFSAQGTLDSNASDDSMGGTSPEENNFTFVTVSDVFNQSAKKAKTNTEVIGIRMA